MFCCNYPVATMKIWVRSRIYLLVFFHEPFSSLCVLGPEIKSKHNLRKDYTVFWQKYLIQLWKLLSCGIISASKNHFLVANIVYICCHRGDVGCCHWTPSLKFDGLWFDALSQTCLVVLRKLCRSWSMWSITAVWPLAVFVVQFPCNSGSIWRKHTYFLLCIFLNIKVLKRGYSVENLTVSLQLSCCWALGGEGGGAVWCLTLGTLHNPWHICPVHEKENV